MSSEFQFISYTPAHYEDNMLGIAKVKAYGKIELRYKHLKKKDGGGTFFSIANYALTDDGEKKYIPSFLIDSRSDEEMLMDCLRSGVKKVLQSSSAHSTQAQGVAMNDQLPF